MVKKIKYQKTIINWSRHIFLLMVVLALSSLFNKTIAQTTQVSLDLKNVTVKEVLQEIEKKTNYYFLYNSELINVQRIVSVSVKKQSLESILNQLFDKKDVSIAIKDKHIVITPIGQSQIEVADGNKLTVAGKVVDEKGNELQGVTVQIKGTQQGDITDGKGMYALNNVAPNSTLVFSYIGMTSKEVAVAGKSKINITLSENLVGIDEVVVVAFGTQNRQTMTTSVSKIDSKFIQNRPVPNVSIALAGQASGVSVVQSSGQPGQGASISIRGAGSLQSGTSPLVVIDGIPGGTLSLVNPNDVESVSVLKDAASSALYGARGANGVILVTTKKAKLGRATINYSGYVGYQNPTELFQESDAYSYANAYNTAVMFDAITRTNPVFNESKKVYTQTQLDNWKNGTVPGTNWRKELFSELGQMQSHNFTLTGGVNGENVYVKNNLSFGYLQQNGNVANTQYKRYTIRDNSEINWKKFTVGFSAGLNYANTKTPTSVAVGDLGSIISAVNRQNPTVAVKTADGDWNVTATNDTNNPVRQALEGGASNSESYNALVNLNLSYELADNLILKFTNGVNYLANNTNIFKNSLEWYTGMISGPNNSSMSNYKDIHLMQQLDLSYNKSFGKHHLSTIIGGQQESHNYNYISLSRTNFINNSSGSMQLGSTDSKDNSSSAYKWAIIGLFGRLNYDYNKKYLFEVDFREDGASRLSPNQRWDFFPSVSAGWRISEEKFWKNIRPIVSELKLRGSYGILGNQDMPGSTTNALYYRDKSIVGSLADSYVIGGVVYNSMSIVQDPNNSCTWEHTAVTDIAAEGELWNKLFTFSLGYFDKTTSGMLMTKTVSAVHGGGSYIANIGKMRNSGVEFSLGFQKQLKNGINISVNSNFTYMSNKILDLGGQQLAASGVYKNTVGYALNSYYLYVNDGLLTKEEFLNSSYTLLNSKQKYGDQKIKDIAGNADGSPDGKINASDKVMINKSSTPKYLYGLNFDVSYKNIGLAGMFQGAADYYKYLGGSVGYGFNSGYSITNWTIENSYDPNNESNYSTLLPRLSVSNTINNTYPTNTFLFNCSYVRLKNLQVYYDIPSSLIKKIGFERSRVYFSGQNLFTLSRLPKALGIDPEIGSATAGYPLVKIFTLGLDVSL